MRYIMNEESTTETQNEQTKNTLPDIPTTWERFTVLIVFGGLMIYMASKGNSEAVTAFATTIATYFLSRQGA